MKLIGTSFNSIIDFLSFRFIAFACQKQSEFIVFHSNLKILFTFDAVENLWLALCIYIQLTKIYNTHTGRCKLTKWLTDAWASITNVFNKTFGLDSNVNVNSTTTVNPDSFTPYQNTEALNNMSERRMYIQNAPLPMTAMTGQQPPIIVEKQSVRDIHITTQVDGRDVRKSINRLDEMDSGR